jgi:hypothetical protein
MKKPELPFNNVIGMLLFGTMVLLPVPVTAEQQNSLTVRGLDNAALQPVRFRLACQIPAANLACNVDGLVVPAGKRLVIEHVSVNVFMDAALLIPRISFFAKNSTSDSVVIVNPVPDEGVMNSIQNPIVRAFEYSRVVKAYFNSGDTVRAQFAVRGGQPQNLSNIGYGQLFIWFQGYLVDL